MIYYSDNDILIRTILASDAKTICEEEIAQGWNQTEEKLSLIHISEPRDGATSRMPYSA